MNECVTLYYRWKIELGRRVETFASLKQDQFLLSKSALESE